MSLSTRQRRALAGSKKNGFVKLVREDGFSWELVNK